MENRAGNTKPEKEATFSSTVRYPNPAPQDLPSFTFIEQDDALASKRIKDAGARKAIRSHVMRDVRRRERLAGMKRVSRRDSKKLNTPSTTARIDFSNEQPANDSDRADKKSMSDDEGSVTIGPLVKAKRPPSWVAQDGSFAYFLQNPLAWPATRQVDPFFTLPGADEVGHVAGDLLHYLTTVLIPMTFPIETKNMEEIQKGLALLTLSGLSMPGAFFSYMTLSAAHRAVTFQNHHPPVTLPDGQHMVLTDPSYYMMKAKTIKEINWRLQNSDPEIAVDDTSISMVVGLISTSLTLGLLEEARVHVKGLKKMVELRGGILNPKFLTECSCLGGVITCDLKAASSLLRRPLFPLPWEPQPYPEQTSKRVFPSPDSPLRTIGQTLRTMEGLSSSFHAVARRIRELLFFDIFNRTDPEGVTSKEYEMFRIRGHEIEYELLDYPYREFKSDENGPKITPLESVARIASLTYISHSFVCSPPPSGVARTMTHHLKTAFTQCLSSQPNQPSNRVDFLAWAAIIGALGAANQDHKTWFLKQLKDFSRLQKWEAWRDLEPVLHGYLYSSCVHEVKWKKIWEQAIDLSVVEEIEKE